LIALAGGKRQTAMFESSLIIDNWEPTPRFCDPINGAFQEINEMFIPHQLTRVFELQSPG